MKKFLLFISVFFITVLQTSAQCPDYTVKSVTAYRTSNKVAIGKIEVTADYAGSYKVLLYHPDNPSKIFASWDFEEGEVVYLSTKTDGRISIGSDWGIQIVFGNGVKSCIAFVGTCGEFHDGAFVVKTTKIYSPAGK